MSAATSNVSSQYGPGEVTNMLSNMGVHPLHLAELGHVINQATINVYEWMSSFALSYGSMMLIISALVWLIAWKFRWTPLSRWASRVIVGVFCGECIVILGPQLYYGFMELLSRL